MAQMLFSERVNAASNIISEMTQDPSERLGIATALCEIYKYELRKYLAPIAPKSISEVPENGARAENSPSKPGSAGDSVAAQTNEAEGAGS